MKNIISLSSSKNELISGYIGGVAGVILNESIISDLNGFALLSDCPDAEKVNVKGAANVIEVLNQYLNIDVDNSGLLNESEKIQANLEEMANKTRNVLNQNLEGKTQEKFYL